MRCSFGATRGQPAILSLPGSLMKEGGNEKSQMLLICFANVRSKQYASKVFSFSKHPWFLTNLLEEPALPDKGLLNPQDAFDKQRMKKSRTLAWAQTEHIKYNSIFPGAPSRLGRSEVTCEL